MIKYKIDYLNEDIFLNISGLEKIDLSLNGFEYKFLFENKHILTKKDSKVFVSTKLVNHFMCLFKAKCQSNCYICTQLYNND